MQTLEIPFSFRILPASLGVPAPPLWTGHPQWGAYRNQVNLCVAGTPQSLNSIPGILYFWHAEGRTREDIVTWALARFRTNLAAAMAKWNANQNLTEFSTDSYLQVGDRVNEYAVAYDWLKDRLTQQERDDCLMILRRAVRNIWDFSRAKWGKDAASYPWTGWATDNPGNNYHYSFVTATALLALITGEAEFRDKTRERLAAFQTYHGDYLPGGGSMEGTGYGQSYRSLFRLLWLWERATGERYAPGCRVDEHLLYWSAATTPDGKAFVAIGDQSRVSYPDIYDYHRAIMLWGMRLMPSISAVARASEWFARCGANAVNYAMLPHLCQQLDATPGIPPISTYEARGVGHVFSRHDATGTLLSVETKTNGESHAALAPGEFQLYTGGKWRVATANLWSHSGIRQSPESHNCLLFRNAAGAIISPKRLTRTAVTATVSDTPSVTTVSMDLSPCYVGTAVTQHIRSVTWDRTARKLLVEDDAVMSAGSASWRVTVSDLPVVNGDGSVSAGAVTIRCLTPATLSPVQDWRAIVPSDFDYANKAWLVEFTGASRYVVEITY